MRRPLRAPVAAVAAVSCALVLSGCEAYDLPLPGSPVDKDHAYEITAEFNDVLNLVPRSPVKVNDVTVGEVTEVEREGWNAALTLRIQDDVVLPENVIADIRQTSLLGEKYVSLEEPTSEAPTGKLSDGDDIPLSQTGRNPELEEVLGALAFLLNGGGIGQMKTITTEINKVFDGRQDSVRHVLGELETLIGGLDEQKGDIIQAMEAMNGLSSTLNREKETVVKAIDSFAPAVEVLADQHDGLMEMLRALDRVGVIGTRVINATQDDLIASLRHLQPVLHEISRANEEIPEALGLLISFPFPIESNDIVHGDYANTSIVFSFDFDNLYKNFLGGEDNGGDTPLPDLPGLPEIPDLPDLPGVPNVPGDPDLPDLPDLPGLSGRPSAATTSSGYATDLTELLGGGQA
jgi:phospholipid/cholesterol/gamma-HCH transport system substrate-binding protein